MKVAIYYDQDGDEVERWTDEKMYIIERNLQAQYGGVIGEMNDLMCQDDKWSCSVWMEVSDEPWDSTLGYLEFNYDPELEEW